MELSQSFGLGKSEHAWHAWPPELSEGLRQLVANQSGPETRQPGQRNKFNHGAKRIRECL